MRKATLMSVCLNSFVMKVVSLPVFVKVAHLRFAGWSSGWWREGEGVGSLGGVSGSRCCVGCYGWYSPHVSKISCVLTTHPFLICIEQNGDQASNGYFSQLYERALKE